MRRSRIFGPLASAIALGAACIVSQPALAQGQSGGASKASVEAGRALAFGRSKGNCLACHQIEGGKLAGNVGPKLVNMKEKYPNRELLFKRIWDETQFNPATPMPPFGPHKILTKQEINKIIDFLYTL